MKAKTVGMLITLWPQNYFAVNSRKAVQHGWQCQMRWCVQCHTHYSCAS